MGEIGTKLEEILRKFGGGLLRCSYSLVTALKRKGLEPRFFRKQSPPGRKWEYSRPSSALSH